MKHIFLSRIRSKMLGLMTFQRLKPICIQLGNTSIRGMCANSTVVQRKHDIVKMENPYKEPPKGCILCNVKVDYRNIQLLSQFISSHTGNIYGRHITGLCSRKQKAISKAIKKAHSMGFMPVTHKHPQFVKDPNICNIRKLN